MITPVLLCGGSGTRLWPLSRKSYPKQFVPLVGETTLFQASATRLSGEGYSAPLVLTNSDFRFIVTEQLGEAGIDPGAILIEPEGRNTAPAVLAAALWLEKSDPDALMLVAPSDHVVPDASAFRAAVQAGADAARAGQLVTFGIKPTHGETGYGYLALAEDPGDFSARPLALSQFVEKPAAARAEEMVAAGTYLWNAGIFLFSVSTILAAFRTHAPDLMAPVTQAVETGQPDLGFLRLAPEPWAMAEDISIDYAVMERADTLAVLRLDTQWSDLGSWDTVAQASVPDAQGNVLRGDALALDCAGTLLRAEAGTRQVLVGLGLRDIIAVAMPDGVLVAHRDHAQDVGQVVAALRAAGHSQASQFPRDHRPWGAFESLVVGPRFQVKRIEVNHGAALSLQRHVHRAEHWIVVSGTAKVVCGEKETLLCTNQSTYVPACTAHRLENSGVIPLVLIEVQNGEYLGEDDIIRYQDDYARTDKK